MSVIAILNINLRIVTFVTCKIETLKQSVHLDAVELMPIPKI